MTNNLQTKQKSENLGRISLGVFLISFIFMTADQAVMIALANFLPKIVGDSGSLYGLAGGIASLGTLVLGISMARWSQKFGRKRILIIGSLFIISGIILLYFAERYWMVLLSRFINGFGSLNIVYTALIHDHFPEEKRGLPLGLVSIGAIIGFLISAIIGGILYDRLGDHDIFLALATFDFLLILIILIIIQDAPEQVSGGGFAAKIKIGALIKDQLLQKKDLLACFTMNFISAACFGGGGSYVVYMIFTYFEVPADVGGLYIIGPTIVEILVFFIVGAKVRNYSKFYKFLAVYSLILLCFPIILFFTESIWVFFVAMTLSGVPLAGIVQSSDAITMKHIPEGNKSELIGLYRISTTVGYLVGAPLFGLMVDFIWPYLPGTTLMLMGILLPMIYWRWVKPAEGGN